MELCANGFRGAGLQCGPLRLPTSMDEVILKVVFKYEVYKTKYVPILFLYVAIVALVYEPRIKSQIGSVLFYG